MTRATWNLRVPVDSPWVVDSDRHWNFSNCSKNIGDIASLVEGYKSQNLENSFFLKLSFFLLIYWLYPSTKMIITPMFFERIEKFQCLSLSTTQGLSTGTLRFHVARVTCPQMCLKVMQLWGAESLNSPGKIFQKSLFSPQGVTTIWFLAKNSMYIFFSNKPHIFEVWS